MTNQIEQFLQSESFTHLLKDIYPLNELITLKKYKKINLGLTNIIYKITVTKSTNDTTLEEDFISKFYLGENSEIRMKKEFVSLNFLSKKGFLVPKPLIKSKIDNISLLIMEFISDSVLNEVLKTEDKKESINLVIELINQLLKLQNQSILEIQEEFSKQGLDIEKNESESTYLKNMEFMIEKSGLEEFRLLLDWLLQNEPSISNQTNVFLHNDFHPFNSLITKDNHIFVIDWEGISFGNPYIDIAWLIFVTAGIFGKVIEDQLLEFYNRKSQKDLSKKDLEYYMLLCLGFRLVIFSVILNDLEGVREKDNTYKYRILTNYGDIIHYFLKRIKEITGFHFSSFEMHIPNYQN